MYEDERRRFLATAMRRHPKHFGASVADYLDLLDDHDALLDVIEPLYEAHGNEVPEPGLLRLAAYAEFYVHGPASMNWGHILSLVARVRLQNKQAWS